MLAPILISVYTRLDLLQKCITSLRANPLSADSDLYVVSDAAKSDADYESVAAVRQYIAGLDGFRSVTALNRETNLGSFLSVKLAIDFVLERHGRVIFLEDDNWVAPNFLQFLNDGLDFYEDDPCVFSVCGYNYPIRVPTRYGYDIYKWQGFSAWGVGLWRGKWQAVDWNLPRIEQIREGTPLRRDLDRIAENTCMNLIHSIRYGTKTMDSIICYYLRTRKIYSIFPVISKVRNLGHDGRGEHGGKTERYVMQPIDSGLPYQLVHDLPSDKEISKVLRKHFAIPLKARLIMMVSKVIPQKQKQWIKDHLYPHKKRLQSD